jgi:hypothetical protein
MDPYEGKPGFQATGSGGFPGREMAIPGVKQSPSHPKKRDDPEDRLRSPAGRQADTATPVDRREGIAEGMVFISGGETRRTNGRK